MKKSVLISHLRKESCLLLYVVPVGTLINVDYISDFENSIIFENGDADLYSYFIIFSYKNSIFRNVIFVNRTCT